MFNRGSFISVIAPFYNVHDYADDCVRSLISQDFDGGFEIVLVDDGSTDGTGDLLDGYSSDSRVHVIHQDNAGLSCARNRGVREAHGEFITFVDGDDIVSPHYLSLLAGALLESGADQAIGRHLIVPGQSAIRFLNWGNSRKYELLDRSGILPHFLYQDVIVSAWAHLAPKETYVKTPFVPGRRYEDDLAFGGQVLSASSFALLKEPIYGYMRRSGSILRPPVISLKQLRDFREGIQAVEEAVTPFLPACASGLTYHKALEFTRLFRLAFKCNEGGGESEHYQSEAVDYVRENLVKLLVDSGIRRGDRARFFALAYVPKLYVSLIEAYERREMKHAQPHG